MARAPLVMIAEDESLVALELEALVEDLGYRVLGPVPTVARGLALLERSRPDVAVIDGNLQGESVTPLAERLASAAIPFALITGYERSQLPEFLRTAPQLPKPVEGAALARTLEGLLSN